jgi:hypothetical protein
MSPDISTAPDPVGGTSKAPDPGGQAYSPSHIYGGLAAPVLALSESSLTSLDTSEASALVTYGYRWNSEGPRAAEVPLFGTAGSLLPEGGPLTDDHLLTAKQFAALENMTPYVPILDAPKDLAGVQAVLNSTPWTPTLPENVPLPTSSAATPSIHDPQLPTPDFVMDEWVANQRAHYRNDPRLRYQATGTVVEWVLDTYERTNQANDEGWSVAWADAIRTAIAHERRDIHSLEQAAKELGYRILPLEDESTPKRARTTQKAETGRKRTRSGSLPPLMLFTPLPAGHDPLVMDTTADRDPVPEPTPSAPLPGLAASIHAPGRTPQEPLTPTPPAPPAQDPVLAAILTGLADFGKRFDTFQVQLNDISTRVTNIENGTPKNDTAMDTRPDVLLVNTNPSSTPLKPGHEESRARMGLAEGHALPPRGDDAHANAVSLPRRPMVQESGSKRTTSTNTESGRAEGRARMGLADGPPLLPRDGDAHANAVSLPVLTEPERMKAANIPAAPKAPTNANLFMAPTTTQAPATWTTVGKKGKTKTQSAPTGSQRSNRSSTGSVKELAITRFMVIRPKDGTACRLSPAEIVMTARTNLEKLTTHLSR